MAAKVLDKAKSALGADKHKHDITMAGRPIGHTGYGLMGLTWRPDPLPHDKSFPAMKTALAQGSNFWNGGELYGTAEYNSLHLLNAYFSKYPEDADKVVISIKGGLLPGQMKPDGSEQNVKRSIEESLRVLDGKKKLDVFECARVDPETPVEITMRAAKKYVESGQLGGICLSECSADTIRRASKEVKIAGVEVEFSLWETTILDNGVAKTCAELDIPIIAYSPLGRGILTGQIKSASDIPEGDMRRHMPRFSPENFDTNMKLVHEVEKLAARKGCTPGQAGLAWVKGQSGRKGMPTIVPIPGSTSEERIKENTKDVELSEKEMQEIEEITKQIPLAGARYPAGAMQALEFGNSPPLKE